MREYLIKEVDAEDGTVWQVRQVTSGSIEQGIGTYELSEILATYPTGLAAAQAVRALIVRDVTGATNQ